MGLLYDLARNDAEGFDHHRRAFARLGQALMAKGISWHEPEITDPPCAHTFFGGFPYSYLTQLDRILVLTNRGEPVTPAAAVSRLQYDRDCKKIDDEMSMLSSHLLCHSNTAGYYVPVDFHDPLFLPDEAEVEGGGMVGSSHRLLAELSDIAPSLGINLDDEGALSGSGEAGPVVGLAADRPFETERFAWSLLYRACLASIAGGHAIVFH
ncbi:hypothetical protein [Streptomyces sp. NPDC050388]|uniref:hypothetical protein n=1 Tax=Streptomyces sp. NPDC050388 TaxID=3155781 RepID=UPI003438F786